MLFAIFQTDLKPLVADLLIFETMIRNYYYLKLSPEITSSIRLYLKNTELFLETRSKAVLCYLL